MCDLESGRYDRSRLLEGIIEILMCADPQPYNRVSTPVPDRAITVAETHGPERIGAVKLLKAQTRMIWVLLEQTKGLTRLSADCFRQCVITLPE